MTLAPPQPVREGREASGDHGDSVGQTGRARCSSELTGTVHVRRRPPRSPWWVPTIASLSSHHGGVVAVGEVELDDDGGCADRSLTNLRQTTRPWAASTNLRWL